MELSARDEICLHLCERDAFFMPPRPGNQHVLDILPKCLVFLEIDYGRGLAAFRVSDELNSGHGRVSLGQVEPVLTLIAMYRPVNLPPPKTQSTRYQPSVRLSPCPHPPPCASVTKSS